MLDRAGGSLLDMTQYTENESPSMEAMGAAEGFAAIPKCPWQPELREFPN